MIRPFLIGDRVEHMVTGDKGTVVDLTYRDVLVRWDKGGTGSMIWRRDVMGSAYRLQRLRSKERA